MITHIFELTGDRSFPVAVIGSKVIAGYDPEKYSEAMGLEKEGPSRRIRGFWIKFAILAALMFSGGTLAWFNGAQLLLDLTRVLNSFQGLGDLGPPAYILTRAATVIILLPTLPLDALAGARFGTFSGSLYSIMGDEAGALISFFLARFLGREAIARLLRKEIAFCDECAERELVYVVFFARLLPMISFGLISYGAGLTQISLRAFALSTLLGMIPLTFLVTYLGGTFNGFNGMSLILGALFAASFFLIPIWIRRRNPWNLYDRMKGTSAVPKKTPLA